MFIIAKAAFVALLRLGIEIRRVAALVLIANWRALSFGVGYLRALFGMRDFAAVPAPTSSRGRGVAGSAVWHQPAGNTRQPLRSRG